MFFLSACEQEAAQTETAAATVAEPQQTPAEAAPAVIEEPRLVCFLDEINALPVMPETEFFVADVPVVRGWIGFVNGNGAAPSNFEIVLTSAEQNFPFLAVAGLPRQDVANSQAKPGLLNAGYETVLSLKAVKPGRYEITMTAPLNDQSVVCGTGKFIVVK
ncbi:MAG: hypothetical protein ACREPB_10485 [Arenimonas sp.]